MPDGVFGVNGRAVTGLPEIHATGLALVFSLDTTHMVTHVRVHVGAGANQEDGESEAATVLSQHFARGKGMEAGQKCLMSGSLYRGNLARDTDGLWKFRNLRIKSIWAIGDWSVVRGGFLEMSK